MLWCYASDCWLKSYMKQEYGLNLFFFFMNKIEKEKKRKVNMEEKILCFALWIRFGIKAVYSASLTLAIFTCAAVGLKKGAEKTKQHREVNISIVAQLSYYLWRKRSFRQITFNLSSFYLFFIVFCFWIFLLCILYEGRRMKMAHRKRLSCYVYFVLFGGAYIWIHSMNFRCSWRREWRRHKVEIFPLQWHKTLEEKLGILSQHVSV